MVGLPRLFTPALWLAVTVASTSIVWQATSLVGADVTDRPPPVVAHEDVVSELASSPSPTGTTPTSTTVKPATSTTIRPGGQLPVAPGATVPPTTPSQTLQPGATVAPPATPATATTVPSAASTPRPPSPPTTQAPVRPTATYSTIGGVVRVACDGFLIDLISAIPNNGYAVQVRVNGPVNVDVHFVRSGQDHSVKAVCVGQPIRYYEQMPRRPGSGSS